MSSETLQRCLESAAAGSASEGISFLDRGERLTAESWASIYERARQVAGGLRDLGIRPGDTVAIVLPTGPAFFDAFFGAQCAGAIPVPLYPPVRLGRLSEYQAKTVAMLHAVRARVLLTDKRVWRILGEVVEAARLPLGCRLTGDVHGASWTHPARESDVAMVQFSSGTTVDPKPVALSHKNVLANVRAIKKVILEVEDAIHVGVSWLPLYHDMGLIGCVFPALEHGASLVLMGPELFIARPALWLRAISKHRAVVSPAPNFAYGYAVDRITDAEMEGMDLSAWRLALTGAEPVSPTTLRRFVERFERWGFRPEALTPVYGLAEASLAVTFSNWRTPFRSTRFDRTALAAGHAEVSADGSELVSVGRPLPGIEIDVPRDTVGPVRVRGPSVMTGYLHQPDRTAATVVDGWLDTGDLGFLHEGELYLSGRAKDLIILRGANHSPHEIEQAVDGVPGVRTGCAAAVSARLDDAEAEALILFVEAKDITKTPDLADACVAAVLDAAALLVSQVVTLAAGTLPRTSSGKIRRAETLRLWQTGELHAPEPVGPLLIAGALARGTLAHWRGRGT